MNESIRPGAGEFFLPGSRQYGVLLIHGFTGAPPELRLLGDRLHDDGGLFLVGGKTVILCMDCSDNAPESEEDRAAWLNEVFDFEPEEMLA